MAEIVGLLGLALAAPSLIDTLVRAGKEIKAFAGNRRADAGVFKRYQALGMELSQGGKLASQVLLIRPLIRSDMIPAYLKEEIESCFKDSVEIIVRMWKKLKAMSDNPRQERLKAVFLAERNTLHSLLEEFEVQQDTMSKLCDQAIKFEDVTPTSRLKEGEFAIHHEMQGRPALEKFPLSDIAYATASIATEPSGKRDIRAVIENKPCASGLGAETEKSIGIMVSKLMRVRELPGMPRCLGYRSNPFSDGFDCIYELPESISTSSLASYLVDSNMPSLSNRIAICRQLSSIVSTVHGIDHVHKSIRPRNILIIGKYNPANEGSQETRLFNWNTMRKASQTSRRLGETDWERAIYQHPERQGLQADRDYHFVHDIYSLGVCMLEIVLARPLITYSDYGAEYNSRFLDVAAQSLAHEMSRDDVCKRLKAGRLAGHARDVLVTIAKTDVPRAAGDRITKIILRCLGGFESPEFPVADPQPPSYTAASDHISQGIDFITNIELELQRICI